MFSQEGNKKYDPGAVFCYMRINKIKCFLIKRIAPMYKNNPNQEENKYQRNHKQKNFGSTSTYQP